MTLSDILLETRFIIENVSFLEIRCQLMWGLTEEQSDEDSLFESEN